MSYVEHLPGCLCIHNEKRSRRGNETRKREGENGCDDVKVGTRKRSLWCNFVKCARQNVLAWFSCTQSGKSSNAIKTAQAYTIECAAVRRKTEIPHDERFNKMRREDPDEKKMVGVKFYGFVFDVRVCVAPRAMFNCEFGGKNGSRCVCSNKRCRKKTKQGNI